LFEELYYEGACRRESVCYLAIFAVDPPAVVFAEHPGNGEGTWVSEVRAGLATALFNLVVNRELAEMIRTRVPGLWACDPAAIGWYETAWLAGGERTLVRIEHEISGAFGRAVFGETAFDPRACVPVDPEAAEPLLRGLGEAYLAFDAPER
jgi:hypothetical protein